MHRSYISLFLVVLVALLTGCATTASTQKNEAIPSVLAGEWMLQVENLQREPLIDMKVRFTTDSAESCIGGDWKKVDVLSEKSFIKNDFQMNNELSYRIQENKVVIGRNLVCDAYLRLRGTIEERVASGSYFAFGMGGGIELGYFTLASVNFK